MAEDGDELRVFPQQFAWLSHCPSLLRHLKWMKKKDQLRQDFCLLGRPGPWRRWVAFMYCFLEGRSFEYVCLTADSSETDLSQRRELTFDGSIIYVDQGVVEAAIKGKILIVEGMEQAERNVLPLLNNLMENREMRLKDGRMLVAPTERESPLPREAIETHRDFRIISLTIPVPPYPGSPLDPPLRSRLQARKVDPPSPAVIAVGATPQVRAQRLKRYFQTFSSKREREIQRREIGEKELSFYQKSIRCILSTLRWDFSHFNEIGKKKMEEIGTFGERVDSIALSSSFQNPLPLFGERTLLLCREWVCHFPEISSVDLIHLSFPLDFLFECGYSSLETVKDMLKDFSSHDHNLNRHWLCGVRYVLIDEKSFIQFEFSLSLPSSLFPSLSFLPQTVTSLVPFFGERESPSLSYYDKEQRVPRRREREERERGREREGERERERKKEEVFGEGAMVCSSGHRVLSLMAQSFVVGVDVCLVGHKGVGKTWAAHAFISLIAGILPDWMSPSKEREREEREREEREGEERGRERGKYFSMFMHSEMSSRDLLQWRRTADSGVATGWSPTPLAVAMEEGGIVILDGIHRLNPSVLLFLSSLLCERLLPLPDRSCVVPLSFEELKERKRVIRVHPSFWVICTAEVPRPDCPWLSHGDTKQMFSFVSLGEQNYGEEFREILKRAVPLVPAHFIEQLLKISEELLSVGEKEEGDEVRLSYRVAIRLAKHFVSLQDFDVYNATLNALYSPLMPSPKQKRVENILQRAGFSPKEREEERKEERREEREGEQKEEGGEREGREKEEEEEREKRERREIIKKREEREERERGEREEREGGESGESGENLLIPNVVFYEIPLHMEILDMMMASFSIGEHLLLLGQQGVGKNKLADKMLSVLGREREYQQLHRDTTMESLSLLPTVEAGHVEWADSALVRAMKHGRVLVLDEIDKASVQVVASLRNLLTDGEILLSDGRFFTSSPITTSSSKDIATTSEGMRKKRIEICQIHPRFRVIALANPPGFPFMGNDFLPEMGDAFTCLFVSAPDLDSEVHLLKMYGPTVDDVLLRSLSMAFSDLRKMTAEGTLAYPYSTRELIQVVRHLDHYPQDSVSDALWNVFAFDGFYPDIQRALADVFKKHQIAIVDPANVPLPPDEDDVDDDVAKKHGSLVRRKAVDLRVSYPMLLAPYELGARLSISGPPSPSPFLSLSASSSSSPFSSPFINPKEEKVSVVTKALPPLTTSRPSLFTEEIGFFRNVASPFIVGSISCGAHGVGVLSKMPLSFCLYDFTFSEQSGPSYCQFDLQRYLPPNIPISENPVSAYCSDIIFIFDPTSKMLITIDLSVREERGREYKIKSYFLGSTVQFGDHLVWKISAFFASQGVVLLYSPTSSLLHLLFSDFTSSSLFSVSVDFLFSEGVGISNLDGIGEDRVIVTNSHNRWSLAIFDWIQENTGEREGEKREGGREKKRVKVGKVEVFKITRRIVGGTKSYHPQNFEMFDGWQKVSSCQLAFSSRDDALKADYIGARWTAWYSSMELLNLIPEQTELTQKSSLSPSHPILKNIPGPPLPPPSPSSLIFPALFSSSGKYLTSTLFIMKEEPLSSLKFPHFGEDGAAGSIYFSWRRNPFSPEDENSSSSSSSSSNSNSKSTSNSPSRSLPSSNLINVVSATWNKNEEDERKELQIIEEKLAREKKGEKGKEKESIFMDEKERVGLVQVNVLSTEASVTLEILEPVLNRIRHLVIATRGGSGSDWGYGIGAVPIGTTSRFAVIRSNGLIHLFESDSNKVRADFEQALKQSEKRSALRSLLNQEFGDQDQQDAFDGQGEGGEGREGEGGEGGRGRGGKGGSGSGGEGGTGSGGSGGSGSGGSGGGEGDAGQMRDERSGRSSGGGGGGGRAFMRDLDFNLAQKSEGEREREREREGELEGDERAVEEIIAQARMHAQNHTVKKVKEVESFGLSLTQLQKAIQGDISRLRVVLQAAEARENERVWMKNQTFGELDDNRLIEVLTGESNVFKRRGEKPQHPSFVQQHPKKIVFVLDLSSSMARFNGSDRRLDRMAATVLMVIEALAGFNRKFIYSIIGQDGDTPVIPLVSYSSPPTTYEEKVKLISSLYSNANSCGSGDNTLPAIEYAVEEVVQSKGDDYFVFAISDANLRQYGLSPRVLTRALTSNPEVHCHIIFLADMQNASYLQKNLPPQHCSVCLDVGSLPVVFQEVFKRRVLKSVSSRL